MVTKLTKTLFTRFSSALKDFGYIPGKLTILFQTQKGGKRAILVASMDNLVASDDDHQEIADQPACLKSELQIKELGP